MKNILILLIMCLMTLGLSAQVSYDYAISTDTLTNADTVYVTMGKTYTAVGTLECGCTISNISGTTAGAARMQVSHNPAGTNFVNIGTDTIAITTGTNGLLAKTLNGYKGRLEIITTGTHSTQVVTGCTYKKSL